MSSNNDPGPFSRTPSRVIARLPAGHFLENITAGPDDRLYVGDYYGQTIYRFRPDEGFRLHAKVRFSPLDLAFDTDGVALVTAHDVSAKAGPSFMQTNGFYLLHEDGTTEHLVAAPNALFLNGVIRIAPGKFLAADSYAGCIWIVDREARSVEVFKRHELFEREDQNSFDPALNGLKVHDGHLWASVTCRGLILRMSWDGSQAGEPEIVESDLRCDDFIFGASGDLYVAGQRDTVSRVRGGMRTSFGDPSDGIRGATACGFGVTDSDRRTLYVSATGGQAIGLHEPSCFVAFEVDDRATPLSQKQEARP